ncbi:hypothetical protein PInf_020293 [Phytophthora infestans]|nr:hypothetical protein PInf_020293 [Phytophthora infestans]
MDEALTRIAPKKGAKRRIQIPIPTVQVDEDLYVLSFDGSARVRGEIDCKAPALTLLRQKVMIHLRGWMNHELVHVKRDWNASADSLASAALRNQCGVEVEREAERQDLVTLNRLDEVVILEETFVKRVRIGRILKTQDEKAWILGLKKYLMGDVRDLSREDAKSYSIIATDYAVDMNDLLFYCPPTKRVNEDRDGLMRLVMPETLQQDVLHHYHASLEGGHQGYTRKLAHLWRGPFRVSEKIGEHAVRLDTAGTEYRLFPVVHVSKLKLVKEYPDRPQIRLSVGGSDRVDFDEVLLPEDSWNVDLEADEFEVEKITDMRSGKRTRYGRIYREFLVYWRGYDEPSWVDEADLNCGALLYDFLRDRMNRNRFGVMQSHEEE